MGIDVRWIVTLKTPRPEDEWRMIQEIKERFPKHSSTRVASVREGSKRTLVIYSTARWAEVSPRAKASPLHIAIADELEILKELVGDLRIYYSHDNLDTPGDYLTEAETYQLLDEMTLVTDDFYMGVGFMAAAAKAVFRANGKMP